MGGAGSKAAPQRGGIGGVRGLGGWAAWLHGGRKPIVCAKELRKDVVRSLEENVAVLLCKMDKIFSPSFFNV
jgi:hypothetical protein